MEKLVHVSKWDMEDVKLSTDERTLAFTINESGRSKLALFALNDQRWIKAENVPSGGHHFIVMADIGSGCIRSKKPYSA